MLLQIRILCGFAYGTKLDIIKAIISDICFKYEVIFGMNLDTYEWS